VGRIGGRALRELTASRPPAARLRASYRTRWQAAPSPSSCARPQSHFG